MTFSVHDQRKFLRLFEILTQDVKRIADAVENKEQETIEDLEAFTEKLEGGKE